MFSKNKRTVRYWNYEIKKLTKFNSFKIPHTALIVKKEIIQKLNYYSTKYNISSDTDFILKMSKLKNLNFKNINKDLVVMDTGGLSNSTQNLKIKIIQDLKIYFHNFGIFFIFIYFYKIFYKFYKLIKWKILG